MVAPLGVWSVKKRRGAFRTRSGATVPDREHHCCSCSYETILGTIARKVLIYTSGRKNAPENASTRTCEVLTQSHTNVRHARSPHSCSRPDNVMHVVQA